MIDSRTRKSLLIHTILMIVIVVIMSIIIKYVPGNIPIYLFLKFVAINLTLALLYWILASGLSTESFAIFVGSRVIVGFLLLILASFFVISFFTIALGALASVDAFAAISSEKIITYLLGYMGILLVILSLNYPMWASYLWNWHKALSDLVTDNFIRKHKNETLKSYAIHTKRSLIPFVRIFMVYSIVNITLNIVFIILAVFIIFDAELVGGVLYNARHLLPAVKFSNPEQYYGYALGFIFIGPIVVFLNYSIFIIATFSSLRPFERYGKLNNVP